MKLRRSIFPVLFIAFVLAVTVSLGLDAYRELGIRGTAREMLEGFKDADPDGWEARVNETIDGEHHFINLFGAIQRAMGKRLVEDAAGNPVAKLSNGQLTFATLMGEPKLAYNALENTVRLKRELGDIPFLAVVAPTKLSNPVAAMPEGASDCGNALGDMFLSGLRGQVDTLDLRPEFLAADPENRWFFNTDHHWRPQGALFACGTLMEELSGRYGFQVNRQALDPDSYDVTVYPELFLGSQGKRVGVYYAGTDDFPVMTPKFETDFEYYIANNAQPRSGPFEKSLCFPERLEKDYFGGNPYTYYSGGDWGRAEIVNLKYPEGPTVVLIRDSYSCALAPFLALQVGKLITVDMRYYSGDLVEELTELSPEAVIILYSASTVNTPQMFEFFEDTNSQ